jgi:elongation factor P--(R)-beta-lysine ligase
MEHLQHIIKNKKNLETRSQIIKLIREFFWSQNFLEVETPLIQKLPGQEPYLNPMKIDIHDENKNKFTGYLHTSPEYTMKKMLASGFEDIFSICKCFRDQESFGGTHNPEFTMIEWYRTDADMWNIMDDVEKLFEFINKNLKLNFNTKFERIHMRDLWQKYININLDNFLDKQSMFDLCKKLDFNPDESEPYEDLFYRIFLNKIEPHLGKDKPQIVHHYPAQMSALAKLSKEDKNYAERFEVYINGLELANAFSELTDSDEQLARLKEEQYLRKKLNKNIFDIDEDFIYAVKNLPKCSGIALGVDRLVQLFTGCKNINNVISLPAKQLFNK